MDRRAFLTRGAAGALGCWAGTGAANAGALAQSEIPAGESRLGLSDDDRDGALYVPKGYRAGVPMPLLMMKFVPPLKAEGYDVTYREYDGGHGVPVAIVREAFEWFLTDARKPA